MFWKRNSATVEANTRYGQATLSAHELDWLVTYNCEVARGIMHTTHWQRRMAQLQEQFRFQQQSRGPVLK